MKFKNIIHLVFLSLKIPLFSFWVVSLVCCIVYIVFINNFLQKPVLLKLSEMELIIQEFDHIYDETNRMRNIIHEQYTNLAKTHSKIEDKYLRSDSISNEDINSITSILQISNIYLLDYSNFTKRSQYYIQNNNLPPPPDSLINKRQFDGEPIKNTIRGIQFPKKSIDSLNGYFKKIAVASFNNKIDNKELISIILKTNNFYYYDILFRFGNLFEIILHSKSVANTAITEYKININHLNTILNAVISMLVALMALSVPALQCLFQTNFNKGNKKEQLKNDAQQQL